MDKATSIRSYTVDDNGDNIYHLNINGKKYIAYRNNENS